MLNLYSQPTIPSVAGSWSRIFLVLCVLTGAMQGDMEGARWLFNWMAALVQRPGRRGMVTPCFIGPQGCGKTAFGNFIARILGAANCAEISGKSLRDDFNSQFVTKLFVVANEIILPTGDRLEILETMKTYLTDEHVDLKTPHARRIQVKNRMSFWLTSNGTNPVRVEDDDDRRNTIFNIPKSVMTEEYRAHLRGLFDPTTQEPTDETARELEALAHDLRTWDVDWELAVTPLKNDARARQIEMSKGSFQQFAELVEDDRFELDRLIHGVLLACNESERADLEPYAFAEGLSVEIVFAAYQRFSKRHGATPLGHARFCGEWGRYFEKKYPKQKRGAEPRKPVFVGLTPPDGALRHQGVLTALAQASEEELRAELLRRNPPDNPDL
jgi:phage/plasmid-associated DNA primase